MTDITPPPPPIPSVANPALNPGPLGKPRNWVTVLLLSIVTLGIYFLVWTYKTFQEMKDHDHQGVGGVVGLIIGIFISIVNAFLLPSEVKGLYAFDGRESPISVATGFWVLLPIIGFIIWLAKVQGAITAYWESKGAVA
jgi:uncharacterized protein DUF4234